MVISLQEVIQGDAVESIAESISRFSCKDGDVEAFLKQKAFDFERRDKSRTFLIFDDDKLLGYFTLSLKSLPFKESVSKSVIKEIDGFSKNVQAVGIVIIGQLGKDSVLAKDVDGRVLLDICMETVYKAKKIVGGRFVMLECQNIKKVVAFYEKNGFGILQSDEKDHYLQMIRKL